MHRGSHVLASIDHPRFLGFAQGTCTGIAWPWPPEVLTPRRPPSFAIRVIMMLFAPVGAASAASLGCLWQCARALTAATAITSRHLSNQLVQRCTCTQAAAASSQPCATRGLPPSAAATARAPGVLAAASARLLAQWGLLPGSLALVSLHLEHCIVSSAVLPTSESPVLPAESGPVFPFLRPCRACSLQRFRPGSGATRAAPSLPHTRTWASAC